MKTLTIFLISIICFSFCALARNIHSTNPVKAAAAVAAAAATKKLTDAKAAFKLVKDGRVKTKIQPATAEDCLKQPECALAKGAKADPKNPKCIFNEKKECLALKKVNLTAIKAEAKKEAKKVAEKVIKKIEGAILNKLT